MIDSIRIFGKLFTVEEVPSKLLAFHEQGCIEHHNGKIGLKAELFDDEKRETLLHEFIHAIEHALQLGLNEQQVGALSVGLWALCQANPKEMRWVLRLDAALPQKVAQKQERKRGGK